MNTFWLDHLERALQGSPALELLREQLLPVTARRAVLDHRLVIRRSEDRERVLAVLLHIVVGGEPGVQQFWFTWADPREPVSLQLAWLHELEATYASSRSLEL